MTSLPRCAPSAQQVDPAAVLALLDALEADDDIEMHSLMVVRGGQVVAEGWWSPYTPERPHLLYSLSKSFTSAAVGIAQHEGLLDLDDTLVSHFPDLDADVLDPRSRMIRLRHVAAMASGHARDMIDDAVERDPYEPVRGFLLQRPDHDPGTVFAYNQPCTYSLATVVQRAAGEPLTSYLRPRLFDPLGIGPVGWQAYPGDREVGFTGLHARTEDVAKLGLLHLQRGRWGDTQVLPEAWVDEATRKHVDNPDEPNPDWQQGYGFQFWMARHGYRGDGAFGQFCVVLPEQDTVVAATACTEAMQSVLDAFWTHLLPGLGRPGDVEREHELTERLRGLALPAPEAEAQPVDWQPWVKEPFPVGPGLLGVHAHSAVRAVAIGHDAAGLELTLLEDDNLLTFPVASGTWAVSTPRDRHDGEVPVAAAGGWWDARTLRVEVLFLETPHRLDVTLSLPDRTAVAAWRLAPLGSDRIADLHCP